MLAFFTQMADWAKIVLILAVIVIVYAVYNWFHYNKVRKQILEMQNSLEPGDIILTQSGLYGRLVSIDKNVAWLQLAEGLTIVIDRFSIKGPAKGDEKAAAEKAQPGRKAP